MANNTKTNEINNPSSCCMQCALCEEEKRKANSHGSNDMVSDIKGLYNAELQFYYFYSAPLSNASASVRL
jgi:hypothetical protein